MEEREALLTNFIFITFRPINRTVLENDNGVVKNTYCVPNSFLHKPSLLIECTASMIFTLV